jgi:hypothetical protein
MKVYRLSKWEAADGHRGFQYFSNRRDAVRALRDWVDQHEGKERAEIRAGSDIDKLDVKLTKQGIVQALNYYASHPDNG